MNNFSLLRLRRSDVWPTSGRATSGIRRSQCALYARETPALFAGDATTIKSGNECECAQRFCIKVAKWEAHTQSACAYTAECTAARWTTIYHVIALMFYRSTCLTHKEPHTVSNRLKNMTSEQICSVCIYLYIWCESSIETGFWGWKSFDLVWSA